MITDKWLVKIGDFGQATIFEGSDRQNKSLGTFQFFPPECCRPGSQEFSGKAADIWALGLTLYSLIYKKLPYAANSIIEIFDNILSFRLVFEPEIDKELEFLIRRLLDKNPETRIKLFELLQDPWLNRNSNPLSPTSYETITLTNEDISRAVIPISSVVLAVSFK